MKLWQSWPYWLKGGVVGGGVAMLSMVLGASCLYLFTSPDSWGFECLPFAIPIIPFWFVSGLNSLPTVLFGAMAIATYFVAGSLIGALLDYIENTHWPHWLQVTIKIFLWVGLPIIFIMFFSYFMPGKSSELIDEGENFTIQ